MSATTMIVAKLTTKPSMSDSIQVQWKLSFGENQDLSKLLDPETIIKLN